MGFMQLLCQEYYWSTALLYNGNWARRMISSRNRFRAIMAFFRCNDHTAMDNDDKLRQVRYLIDKVNSPVKIFSNAARKLQLMKEWCDRSTDQVCTNAIKTSQQNGGWNYGSWLIQIQATHIISMRILKKPEQEHQEKGLDMTWSLNWQSASVIKVIMYILTISTPPLLFWGTWNKWAFWVVVQLQQTGSIFPKKWKQVVHGPKRWTMENKGGDGFMGMFLVSSGTTTKLLVCWALSIKGVSVWCRRRCKDPRTGRFSIKVLKQPKAIQDYNRNMKGVDQSDQLIGSYCVLRKVKKYWKVLFSLDWY